MIQRIGAGWWIAIVMGVLTFTGIGNSLLKQFGISGLRLGAPPLSLSVEKIYCSDVMDYDKQGVFECSFWYTVSNPSTNPIGLEDTCFITYDGSNFTDGQLKKGVLNPGVPSDGFCTFDGIPKDAIIETLSLRDRRQVVDAEISIDVSPKNFRDWPSDW